LSAVIAGKAEGRLFDCLTRLERLRQNRIAVYIHISKLRPENRREHNLRIAKHTFDNILGQHEGEIFVLENHDIVFIAEGVPRMQLERSIERLRGLFTEDPLVYASGTEGNTFCTWYDLGTEYDKLLALSKVLMRRTAMAHAAENNFESLEPVSSHSLAKLEDVLVKADISNFVRNQTVCLYAQTAITPIFDELYVSIPDLQKALLPNHNLRGNKWLFQHITETLDKRMLAYIAALENRPDRVFSINLNISSVLSAEFQAYDRALSAGARGGNLVIEIQKHDIFSDMGAYIFAQEFLKERTHKLCLDGITHLTIPFIDRDQLKLDLIKLCWSQEILDKRDRIMPELHRHVERIGGQRCILIHCDTPEALDIGRELGISMFQGRYVTHMLQRARQLRPKTAANG
jgi:EAL domain-containing protein (putative c-di-GMP-specific phosphodiesterase class I)